MNALDHLRTFRLFRRPAEFTSWQKLVLWWEFRRIAYNIIVGAAGMLVLAVLVALTYTTTPSDNYNGAGLGGSFLGLATVLLYGIMANICYTAGWISELFVRRVWKSDAGRYGEIVFMLGMAFSVLLTLAPLALFVPEALYTRFIK